MLIRARRPRGWGRADRPGRSTATAETRRAAGTVAGPRPRLANWATSSTSRRWRRTRKMTPAPNSIPRTMSMKGASSSAATCQISVLRKRKVAKSRSNGQRADHQVGHVGQLAEHLAQRPPGHGHEAVAGDDEGHRQDHQVQDHGAEGVGHVVLAEQRGQDRRAQDEEGQLGGPHPVGPLERPTPPQTVHHHDPTDQDRQATEQGQGLVPALPVLVQAEGQFGQEHHRQERGGPGPDVGGGPVVVDEVGQAPPDEPPLGPTAEVGPAAVIHPRESGP